MSTLLYFWLLLLSATVAGLICKTSDQGDAIARLRSEWDRELEARGKCEICDAQAFVIHCTVDAEGVHHVRLCRQCSVESIGEDLRRQLED